MSNTHDPAAAIADDDTLTPAQEEAERRVLAAWVIGLHEAGRVTATQLDAGARALYERRAQRLGAPEGHSWDFVNDYGRELLRRDAAAVLTAAGFTVTEEEEA